MPLAASRFTPMRATNFLRIAIVTLALSGYAVWSRSSVESPAEEQPGAASIPAADAIPLLRLREAAALWRKPGTLFVDVRSDTDFAYGHIAGAVHLPEEEFEERFPALQGRLQEAPAVVVYCKSPDCGKSLWVALRLHRAGVTVTSIYPAGWNEWVSNGYPVVRAER